MNLKLRSVINFTLSYLLPLFCILLLVITFYFSTAKILLWDIVRPLIDVNVHRILSLIGLSQVQVDITAFIVGAARFVMYASALLLMLTNKYIRHGAFWLACLPLAAILIISGVSRFWSITPEFTISRFLYFMAAGLGGVFIGFELNKHKIIWVLEAIAVLMVLGNLFMVLKHPSFAIMSGGSTLEGAWRGLFTWKDYAGEVMAFASIMFLFRLINFKNERWIIRIYSLVFYALSVFMVFKSQSATEMISLFTVHIILVPAILYLKWGRLLKPIHWWIFCASGLLILLVVWFSRDAWLGFIGRSSSFTGRLPLWEALIPFIKQKLLLGYGFGEAFWKSGGYAAKVSAAAGWDAPFAHNGYIEALLGTGIVGLGLFLVFLIQIAYLSLRYFSRKHNLPALIFFAWFVDIAVSNFGDNQLGSHDPFTWLLLVLAFSILTRDMLDQQQPAPAASPQT
jgi:O-antigen ligase